MIKFQLFDTENSYQCHFAEISTFVVSIAHYMRAYFNYQALTYGKEYVLPEDAAFLNVSRVVHVISAHLSTTRSSFSFHTLVVVSLFTHVDVSPLYYCLFFFFTLSLKKSAFN